MSGKDLLALLERTKEFADAEAKEGGHQLHWSSPSASVSDGFATQRARCRRCRGDVMIWRHEDKAIVHGIGQCVAAEGPAA